MKRYIIPFAIAQVADFVTTVIALNVGAYEVNVAAKFIMAHGGLPLWAALKVLSIVIAIIVMGNAKEYGGKFSSHSKLILVVITVATFLVAAWNSLVIFTEWKL